MYHYHHVTELENVGKQISFTEFPTLLRLLTKRAFMNGNKGVPLLYSLSYSRVFVVQLNAVNLQSLHVGMVGLQHEIIILQAVA